MVDVSRVRAAIAATLRDHLPGVNVYPVPVDNINPPALLVAGADIEMVTFDGNLRVTFDVYAVVRRTEAGWGELDSMVSTVGPMSVWDAFDRDPTLGAVVGGCSVVGVGDFREQQFGEVGYWAATLRCEVTV